MPRAVFEGKKMTAYVLGTGSAYGHHYTTEEMKVFFKKARAADGDVDFPGEFSDRVLDACGFDRHSVCLPPEKVFRRMTRNEYLDHRMDALLDMACQAARQALNMWNPSQLSKVTHLYWGTMTGGMHSPTIDIHLAKRLGLDMNVTRLNVEGMGCLTGEHPGASCCAAIW